MRTVPNPSPGVEVRQEGVLAAEATPAGAAVAGAVARELAPRPPSCAIAAGAKDTSSRSVASRQTLISERPPWGISGVAGVREAAAGGQPGEDGVVKGAMFVPWEKMKTSMRSIPRREEPKVGETRASGRALGSQIDARRTGLKLFRDLGLSNQMSISPTLTQSRRSRTRLRSSFQPPPQKHHHGHHLSRG